MIDFIYETLASFGFDHPLHPIAVHLPMGMIIGGLLFAILGFKWDTFTRTAHYCYTMALVFIAPTIITGLLDWQYRMVGNWTTLIGAKIALGCTLTILLAVAVWFGYKKTLTNKAMLFIYALCSINTAALGYIGGELVYG